MFFLCVKSKNVKALHLEKKANFITGFNPSHLLY